MSYFKPNTKKAIKVATFIKGITATLATTAYVNGNANYMFAVMILGGVCNELINILSDNENPKSVI